MFQILQHWVNVCFLFSTHRFCADGHFRSYLEADLPSVISSSTVPFTCEKHHCISPPLPEISIKRVKHFRTATYLIKKNNWPTLLRKINDADKSSPAMLHHQMNLWFKRSDLQGYLGHLHTHLHWLICRWHAIECRYRYLFPWKWRMTGSCIDVTTLELWGNPSLYIKANTVGES